MRVVLLNQYYAPDEAATAQLLADLGEGLARSGHEVHAICSRRAYRDPALRYPARETLAGVQVTRGWCTGFGRGHAAGRLLDYLTFLTSAAAMLARAPRPDAVIALSTPPMVALLGVLMSRLRGAHTLYWVMDVYPELAFELGVLRPRSLAGRSFGALSRGLLRRSDGVVALGETMAGHLRRAGATSVHVIHNWADGDVIRPVAIDDHPLRKTWGWDRRLVLLYSGNMGLAHEFGTLLDAAQRLRDEPTVLFAFVGGGPRRDEVLAEVKRRGLNNVEFRPYVPREELGSSLTAGDVHLVTLRDAMPGLLVPSKIYGILAAGRPCLYVGPDRGEIADILGDGDCGLRVASGDAEGLVAAIRAYREDPTLRRTHGARARALFEARYTRQHGLDAFRRLLETARPT